MFCVNVLWRFPPCHTVVGSCEVTQFKGANQKTKSSTLTVHDGYWLTSVVLEYYVSQIQN